MAKGSESVAGIVDALEGMKRTIAQVPQEVAEAFLESTLVDTPTPPRDTGGLRKSGAAYIGGTLVATAQSLAVGNSKVTQDMLEPKMLTSRNGLVRSSSKEVSTKAPAIVKRISAKILQEGGVGRSGRRTRVRTIRGKVTIRYSTPYAALMHEWTGKMHEPGAGPGFVSQKAFTFSRRASIRTKRILQEELAKVRRR